MIKKKYLKITVFLPLFSFLSLLSCSNNSSIAPNLNKEIILFKSEIKEGESFEDSNKVLSALEVNSLLNREENLALIVSSKTCSSCHSLYETYQEIKEDIPYELFVITPNEAQKLSTSLIDNPLKNKGTPNWFFIKDTSTPIISVQYGDNENKFALKNNLKQTYKRETTSFIATRYWDYPSFLKRKENKNEELSFVFDGSNEESLSFYKQTFLPFLKKNSKEISVLDITFFLPNEKEEIYKDFAIENKNSFFLKDNQTYPLNERILEEYI